MAENFTGYPHIDKPWQKYYGDLSFENAYKDMSVTRYLKEKAKGHEKVIATEYYGNKINYEQYFERVDKASAILEQIGASKNKRLMDLTPNIPETGQIFLGAAQIGATSDFIDPRPDSMDMIANANKVLEMLKYENTDYIVALDKCYLYMLKPIEHQLKDMGINKIIVLSPDDSMNLLSIINYFRELITYNGLNNERLKNAAIKKLHFYEALFYKLQKLTGVNEEEKNKITAEAIRTGDLRRISNVSVIRNKIEEMHHENKMLNEAIITSPIEVLRYSDLLKECSDCKFTEINDGNLISYIGHTSGTSGARPKPIPLTNNNQISSIEQLIQAGVRFEPGDKYIHELPFFAPFGTGNNFILSMACCATSIDIPEFQINEFGYLIKRYHPNIVLGTPSWLVSLMNCKYLENEDLSCIKRIVYGGDSMTPEDEKKLCEWLAAHNCNTVIEKGHGMSEINGSGSYAQKEWNDYDTIGIPLPDTIYSIVDPNVEDKLVPIKGKPGETIFGELVISSDAVTPGVLDGNVIVKHYQMDGRDYIRTRDLVRMRPDGVFEFDARKDRSFTRFDGYKVKPFEIEPVILEHDRVKYCCLVQYFDDSKHGLMPIAHVVLNDNVKITSDDDYIEIVKDIINKQFIGNPNMSSRQIPARFKFKDSLPLSKNGKVDFNSLANEPEDGSEIMVEVSETNLTVGGVSVYRNQKTQSR